MLYEYSIILKYISICVSLLLDKFLNILGHVKGTLTISYIIFPILSVNTITESFYKTTIIKTIPFIYSINKIKVKKEKKENENSL